MYLKESTQETAGSMDEEMTHRWTMVQVEHINALAVRHQNVCYIDQNKMIPSVVAVAIAIQ